MNDLVYVRQGLPPQHDWSSCAAPLHEAMALVDRRERDSDSVICSMPSTGANMCTCRLRTTRVLLDDGRRTWDLTVGSGLTGQSIRAHVHYEATQGARPALAVRRRRREELLGQRTGLSHRLRVSRTLDERSKPPPNNAWFRNRIRSVQCCGISARLRLAKHLFVRTLCSGTSGNGVKAHAMPFATFIDPRS